MQPPKEPRVQQEQILAELRGIMNRDPNGMLRADAVVQIASDPSSPLHRYFTWDDARAAEKQRLREAQMLIKNVEIFIEPLNIKVRAFTSLDLDRQNQGGYRLTTAVMADQDLRDQLLSTALRELKEMESRFRHLSDLANVWTASQEVAVKLDQRKKQVIEVSTTTGAI